MQVVVSHACHGCIVKVSQPHGSRPCSGFSDTVDLGHPSVHGALCRTSCSALDSSWEKLVGRRTALCCLGIMPVAALGACWR